MDHTCNLPNASARQEASALPCKSPVTRRGFIKFFSVGAAALAVQGCGGGGGMAANPTLGIGGQIAPTPTPPAPVTPVAPAPTPVPAPVWLPIPALVFTQGVPASISIANYVSAADVKAFTVSIDSTPLPSGVTFNSAARAFDYDGRGTIATSDGHVLIADVG